MLHEVAGEADEVFDLLTGYADAMAALRSRGVTRSANSPISDFAEHLAVWHYRGSRTPSSTKSHDVVATDGRRIEVKAMWQLRGTRTSLSALRDLESGGFDLLLAVVFAADLRSWSG